MAKQVAKKISKKEIKKQVEAEVTAKITAALKDYDTPKSNDKLEKRIKKASKSIMSVVWEINREKAK
jgi:hypothetical protein